MENTSRLVVSSSPHIHTARTTPGIMLDVIIALLPATVMSIVWFGLSALWVLLSCVASSVVAELLFNLILHKKQTVGDYTAVLTGLLLGLNMHAQVPIWQCVVGSVFSIIVVKMLFGGLGCNFANPAIAGRVFLLICFEETTGGVLPKVDTVTSATPLDILKNGSDKALPSLLEMFLGNRAGAIGETCILALLVGFVYLVIRKVIHFETPLIFMGTVFLFALIFKGDFNFALYQLMGGGLVLGAVFMATDYVTTPITRSGKMIFALGCGLITSLIRFYGSYPEGVSFSILLMNILSPYIEKWTAKKPLGGVKA